MEIGLSSSYRGVGVTGVLRYWQNELDNRDRAPLMSCFFILEVPLFIFTY